jgi:hypothetical protein
MLTVKDSFFWNGRLYAKGLEVDPSDPVVSGRRRLFDGSDVEQATAVHGVTRAGKRPASRPTKPATARK